MKSRSNRLPTISADDWGDESWVVDCVCGVDFDDGEEMVDCDECGVWVHTRCSSYVKSENMFTCDKCKSKKLRNESEETEVAQLLVELPTKTLCMDNPYPMGGVNQNLYQVLTEVPIEKRVHVQGVPGGDRELFSGVSSIFSPELWKCKGYVPKKFNHQYREFPCWDENRDDDDDKDEKDIENHTSNGADALFSLSKENAGVPAQVNGGGLLGMGPPSIDTKTQELESYEGRHNVSVVKKERSLMKPIVIYSGSRKKDGSKGFRDPNRKKNVKPVEKEEDSKKDRHPFESVTTTSSDAKPSESNEVKDLKVSKNDKQSRRHESLRVDVQAEDKSDDCLDNNKPSSSGQPSENVDDTRLDPLREAKQMEENDRNQATPIAVISPRTEAGMASSSMQNSVETSSTKHEAGHDIVDGANDNGRSYSKSNGTQSDTNKLEKVDPPPNVKLDKPAGPKPVDNNHPEKTSNSRKVSNSDPKLDGSKTLIQDTRISKNPSSASLEPKNDTVSRKVQSADKNVPHNDSKADEPNEPHIQPKGHKRGSERPPEAQSRSHGTVRSPSRASNQRKVIASTVAKSSAGKPSSSSSKPSVPDKARDPDTDSKRKKDNTSSDLPRNGDASEKAKKPAKDLPKSSSMSALKSSHLSKSSHAHVSKKNSTDIKEPSVVSSSKTSSVQKTAATPESGDSANSELSVRGDKISQLNRHLAPKHHPPHVQPPASTNTPAALSDEELALLLHQELNSSPRVPRVPRMRNAGSLPQLNSPTSTSTLLKRSSTSLGKDNGLVSRKRNKDSANNGPSNSHEFDRAKKVDRSSSLPNSRKHDHGKNGSAKAVHPPGSTTASSGRSSSTEHNQTSDDETGAVTHRTLPALLAEIMSKGKRMTYEELCNEVLPHWPNLRKHNGERYAYSSHSQAVLDCLRNRSEWSRLIDRGPKTNAGRKRRKPESDTQNLESEDEYSTDRNSKEDTNDYPKGKRKARKQRRLQRRVKDVRRRRKAEVVSDDSDSSSESSEESEFSDEEMQEGTSGPNEASASSDETGS